MLQRRDFLLRAGAFASAGLMQGGAPTAHAADGGDGEETIEQKFADFALSVRYDDLPKEVVASAKRVLLDTLACAFGAVGSEPANIAEKTIRKTFGDGNSSTIIGYPRAATVEGALFVNGVLVRALDLNDTYIGTDPLHPSEVLPTALALCEEKGRSGRELIEAMVVGYEASMRVNDALSFM
jgi:2-methylcitrate dehydratase